MKYCSTIKRNETGLFAVMWINLGSVIQTEVSQKEKNKILYIIKYIWNLEKWYWGTYLEGRNRDTETENRLVDSAGEGESEVAQSCLTLWPHGLWPTRLLHPWKFSSKGKKRKGKRKLNKVFSLIKVSY